MERKQLSRILAILFCVWSLVVLGCNDSDDDDATATTPTALTSYGEDVAECTPQIAAGSEELPAAEENASISLWAGWDPTIQYTVFNKLLSDDSAEGLFDPIEKADMFVEIINAFSSYWVASGTYEDIPIPDAGGSGTVDLTIEAESAVVTIPFFGGTVTVDRVITIDGNIDGMGTFQCKMGFTTGAGEEEMVVRTSFTETGEVSMFYGSKASDGLMNIWAAVFTDKATVATTDDFGGAIKWRGNPDEGWFAISQGMSGAGGSKIMAGGEPDGSMAFLASRLDDNVGPDVPYYLVCTIANITGGTAPAGGSIINGNTTPPLEATTT
ncbi:MAG: hypothetical protein EG828_16130, partial [Deltaproteobacteria bacterium]|nr:hypothetical protein [Deltaproteobacteria bacterium]